MFHFFLIPTIFARLKTTVISYFKTGNEIKREVKNFMVRVVRGYCELKQLLYK